MTDIEKVHDLWYKICLFSAFICFYHWNILKKVKFYFKKCRFLTEELKIPSKHILTKPTTTTEARQKFLPLGNLKMKTKCVE